MIKLTFLPRVFFCFSAFLFLISVVSVLIANAKEIGVGNFINLNVERTSKEATNNIYEKHLKSLLIPESVSPVNSVYVRSQKVRAGDGASQNGFGDRVAIAGNIAVVGNRADDIGSNMNQGSAYVYYRSGDSWFFWQKLTAGTSGAAGDEFGYDVDIDGNTIVVGAIYDDSAGILDRGAAYVFVRANNCDYPSTNCWTATKILDEIVDFTGDNRVGDRFGISVGIEGNKIIVGSSRDDTTQSAQSGSVSLFNLGETTAFRKIIGPSGGSDFGTAVGISGTRVIVGAPQAESDLVGGHAYIYSMSGNLERDYVGSISRNGFGNSVAIDEGTAVIGALTLVAKAYVVKFLDDNVLTDLNPNSNLGTAFGKSVSVDEDLLVVGAPGSGKIQIFRRINNMWTYKDEVTQPETINSSLGGSVSVFGHTFIGGATGDGFGAASIFVNVPSRQFDFENDELANISVFRPSNNTWYIRASNGGFTTKQFGATGDILTPADFDGDGKTDVAVFRPSDGTWYVQGSSQGFFTNVWGQSGDIPLPSDFNGDGKADFVIFRPSSNVWYWKLSSDLSFDSYQFGNSGAGDIPLIADFDGDQRSELAVFRPSTGNWVWRNRVTSTVTTREGWGVSGDIPVPSDYDGDLKTDTIVFRPSNSTWYRWYSSNNAISSVTWGASGDKPVPADYDGDGETDIAVFRTDNINNTGTWYIVNSSYPSLVVAPTSQIQFGEASDIAIPTAFH